MSEKKVVIAEREDYRIEGEYEFETSAFERYYFRFISTAGDQARLAGGEYCTEVQYLTIFPDHVIIASSGESNDWSVDVTDEYFEWRREDSRWREGSPADIREVFEQFFIDMIPKGGRRWKIG